jgi:hypothetical protein
LSVLPIARAIAIAIAMLTGGQKSSWKSTTIKAGRKFAMADVKPCKHSKWINLMLMLG